MVLVTTITSGPLRFEAQKQAMLNAGVPGVIAEDSARWLSSTNPDQEMES